MAYNPIASKSLYKFPVDFFARRTHFVDHMLPIWEKMPTDLKGQFYVPRYLQSYCRDLDFKVTIVDPQPGRGRLFVSPGGKGPVVTCAYNDMEMAYYLYNTRPMILMEHGVGLSFGHPGYGGGEGLRRRVSLFLAPNQNIYDKTRRTFPHAPQVIIGTPKMDRYANRTFSIRDNPIIGVSFHWDGKRVCPEAGNALAHYQNTLPELSKYDVVGHGHPKIMDKLEPLYRGCGFGIERDFRTVIEHCDFYINDASSTMYEFACTEKPVVILNAPWFRRHVHHGIRFWDYTDIGIQVDEPEDLIPAIEATIKDPDRYREQRIKMREELYPHFGTSATVAAQAIADFVRSKRK